MNLGVGYGFTPGSDRFVLKTIVGYAFPVPGGTPTASERAPSFSSISNPMSRSSIRQANFERTQLLAAICDGGHSLPKSGVSELNRFFR